MRKLHVVLVVAVLPMAIAASCAERQPQPRERAARRVLCTTYPVYLFALNVAASRDAVTLELMLPASLGCPHDYVVTPQDMQRITAADLVLANGLGLEAFLGEAIGRANPSASVVEVSQNAGEILWVEGHETPKAGRVPNPHLFASPERAAAIVRTIAAALTSVDPEGGTLYAANAEAYATRLERLAADGRRVVARLRSRRIVTEHAVFDYLARDIGLQVVAVVEEEPGQAPSAAKMLEIVRRIRAAGAAAVFTEPQYPAHVGQRIAREAGIPVAVLDPVATGPEHPPLGYYEQVMSVNFATLVRVLGEREPREQTAASPSTRAGTVRD